MAIDEKLAARGTIATVVATAAVTLAIGVTTAALGGYVGPVRDADEIETPVTDTTVVAAPAAAQPGAAHVVLVPVAPDPPRTPRTSVPAEPTPEVLVAAYEPSEHDYEDDDDHRRGREHRDRDHEHDHDDD